MAPIPAFFSTVRQMTLSVLRIQNGRRVIKTALTNQEVIGI
jgi:hypothetical protein